jgi:preprotein translocase subunit YajC
MRRLFTGLTAAMASISAFAQIPAADSSTTAATTQVPQHSSLPTMVMIVVMIVVFWLFLIRPQMKRNKEQKSMMSSLSAGDEVSTIGGLYGKVSKVADSMVELEIAKDVKVKIQKQAVANILPKGTVKSL